MVGSRGGCVGWAAFVPKSCQNTIVVLFCRFFEAVFAVWFLFPVVLWFFMELSSL